MSDIADAARVSVLLADYAAADAVSKVNILGAGWQVTGIDTTTGNVAPQVVVVMVDTPPHLYSEDFALTLTLVGDSGEPVELPGPSGEPQAMRLARVMRAERPEFKLGTRVPNDTVWAHTQLVFNAANGLPLSAGMHYTWRVDIDGTHNPSWAVSFFVAGNAPPPVLG